MVETIGASMDAKTRDQAQAGTAGEALSWLSFPAHERLLNSGKPPGLLEKMEETKRYLASLEKTGTPSEAARARAGRIAYGHALELLVAIRESAGQKAQLVDRRER
jgi:hypothetical protein